MAGCCVPGCSRSSLDMESGMLYRIPEDEQSRSLWLEALKCTHFTEEEIRASRVCSAHFISGKMSLDEHNPDFVPSVFPKEKRIKKPNLNPDFVTSVFLKKKRIKKNNMNPDFVTSVFPKKKRIKKPNINPDFVPSVSAFPKNKKKKLCSMKTDGVPKKRKKKLTSHNLEASSSSTSLLAGKDIEIEWPDLVDLSVQHKQLQEAYTNLQSEVDALSARNERLREDLHRFLPRFSYASVKGDEEQIQFLTGLHTLAFDWLVSQAADKIEALPELTQRDHLLMILMKLKLGLCDTDLAYRFGIRESFVTRICQTWLPALAAMLKPLVAWPRAQVVSKSSPGVFQGKFKSCRCIIDFPEFVVATVGESEDKHERTVKYFASVTPAGVVSFLSSGCSAAVPERRIIKQSGFLQLVEPEDEILANRQIPIRDELASRRAALHVPDPNNRKQAQKRDSEKQRCPIWTHVKKASGWWKEFNMLQKAIPEPYADLLDQVLIVCAVLNNVNMSLTPKDKSQS